MKPKWECQECGGQDDGYSVKDPIWNKFYADDSKAFVCLECFENKREPLRLDDFEWCPLTVKALIIRNRVTVEEAFKRAFPQMVRSVADCAALNVKYFLETFYYPALFQETYTP